MEMQHELLIRNKVSEIGSAIFYNVSDAPKPFSAGLISSVQYDEDGLLYFFASRPKHLVQEDCRFPAVLDFYRKGKPYFLKINGTAELVTDERELLYYRSRLDDTVQEPASRPHTALVRLRVERVEYTDHTAPTTGFFQRIRSAVHSWF